MLAVAKAHNLSLTEDLLEPERQAPSRTVYLRRTRVAYFSANGEYLTAASQAWSKIFDWLDRYDLHVSAGRGYGLVYGDPRNAGASSMRYDACVILPANKKVCLSSGMGVQDSPLGPYVNLRHVGNHALLRRRFADLFGEWPLRRASPSTPGAL